VRGGEQTLDIVVRGDEGLSLNLSAAQLAESRLGLAGALVDREIPSLVKFTINAAFAPEFVEGAHIQRDTKWVVLIDEAEISFGWNVERYELPDGYVLQDARVWNGEQEIRAFAIEDLAATIGIGLAVAVGGLLFWRQERVRIQERTRAEKMWNQCLDAGKNPSWHVAIEGGAALGPDGLPTFTSRADYRVDCS
jgi:hypothetical protein